jgi:hypothetical protein
MDSQQRIHAFLGNDKNSPKDGGGLTIPAIFSPIMEHLQDKGDTTIQDVLPKIERGHPGGTNRIKEIFGTTENCIEQAFYHLIERGYANRRPFGHDGGFYITYGYALVPGVTHEVFKEKEHGVSIKVDLQTAEEREKRLKEDRRSIFINEWLNDMDINNLASGFRQIHKNRRLENSISEGWNSESKIIVDENGHLVDGKRRIIACHEFNMEVPPEAIRIFRYASVEDMFLHAWKLNADSTWVDGDKDELLQRLHFLGIDENAKPNCEQINKELFTKDLGRKVGPAVGTQVTGGSPARIYLMENPGNNQTDVDIARILDVLPQVVQKERKKLEGLGFLKRKGEKSSLISRVAAVLNEYTVEEVESMVNYFPTYLKERKSQQERLKDPEELRMFVYGDDKNCKRVYKSRGFSEEERQQLIALVIKGTKYKEMGKTFSPPRSENAISGEIHRLRKDGRIPKGGKSIVGIENEKFSDFQEVQEG